MDQFLMSGKDYTVYPSLNTFPGPLSGMYQNNAGVGSNKHESLKQLLQNMDRSIAVRHTIGEWAKQNSTTVQSLTPTDWETILGKVTFSLDQTAVIGELL